MYWRIGPGAQVFVTAAGLFFSTLGPFFLLPKHEYELRAHTGSFVEIVIRSHLAAVHIQGGSAKRGKRVKDEI